MEEQKLKGVGIRPTQESSSDEAATRLSIAAFDILGRNPTIGPAEALRLPMLAYLGGTSDDHNAYPACWRPFSLVG